MYDTMHMGDAIQTLASAAGDTSMRYSDLTSYITQGVSVRVTSTSSFLSVYYNISYLERPPSSVLPSLILGTTYPLNISYPYITVMVVSYGGPSTYLLEYGRIDEMGYLSFATPNIPSLTLFTLILVLFSFLY
jgi:hypothetical protein